MLPAAPAFGSPLPCALHLIPIQHQPQGKKTDGKMLTSGIWKENLPTKVLLPGEISALQALGWNPDFPPIFPLCLQV